MKKVLITGATGFVGSHILEHMMHHPEIHVVAACRNKNKLIPEFNGEVRQGDLRDPDYVERLLEEIDVICHAAAWSSLWGHEKESKSLYLAPSLNLIDQAIKKGVKCFINTSTTSATPALSADALNPGIKKPFWPHLSNLIEIENTMKRRSDEGCQMINLRLGLFVGERYGLGLLPILLPRLKTHLVPWVKSGHTSMPLIDGRDIGLAFTLASLKPELNNYESFNIVGPSVPTAREVITFIHNNYAYPKPHFNVPFFIAYPFAHLMEWLDSLVPWEPLIVRTIVHLLENTDVDNQKAFDLLGYQPEIHWQQSVRLQIDTMQAIDAPPMKMVKQIN